MEKADRFDDVANSLQRAVKNFSRGIVDDTLKTNAEFHSKSGLHPVVVRQSTGKCCEWCDAIAGTYKYPDKVPKVVYSRHDNCRCSVDYKPDKHSKTVQNVHSKRWTDEKTLAERKTTGLRQPTTAETQAEREKVGLLGENKRRQTVDNSGDGGIMNNGNCIIASDKIEKFFLSPGKKHSAEFFDVGYTQKNSHILEDDLKKAFSTGKIVDRKNTENGVEKFSIFTDLGVTKKKRFRIVWQKDTPDSVPRIITAHREDK